MLLQQLVLWIALAYATISTLNVAAEYSNGATYLILQGDPHVDYANC